MILEIKIPSPGESISEVEIGEWLVEDGSYVEKDQEIAEVESEKATLPIIAEESGKVRFLLKPGTMAKIGEVICHIDTDAQDHIPKEKKTARLVETKKEVANIREETTLAKTEPAERKTTGKIKITPVAGEKMKDYHLSIEDVLQGLRRIGSEDIEQIKNLQDTGAKPVSSFIRRDVSRETSVEKMSQLRRKLSARLVSVKNETAMLTTFNETDMGEIIRIRRTYQEEFIGKHHIKLGFMSFFIKATSLALMKYPGVNSIIDGEEIITYHYTDIGVAVQTDKGLMVPVIRNAEALSLSEIETELKRLAEKARKNRISMDEMNGGTFTITNGGVFGSMLSTPLLNPPQAAILGMHNIVERPVAIRGKVKIRPIMYLALSYDHRLVDGRDSVTFLKTIKDMIEHPTTMLFGGTRVEEQLLDL